MLAKVNPAGRGVVLMAGDRSPVAPPGREPDGAGGMWAGTLALAQV